MSSRRIVHMITWPMNLIGVNPLNRKSTAKRTYLCIFFFFYGICGTILFSIHADGNFYNAIIPIAYCTCLMMVSYAVLDMRNHKCRIKYLLTSFNEFVFVYPDEANIKLKYDGFICESGYSDLVCYMLIFEIAGFVAAGSSPFVGCIFVGKLRTFIYPGWVPWDVDSVGTYIITYILQIPVASSVFWVYYILQVYFTFVLVEFLRQIEKLRQCIRSLHERTCNDVLGNPGINLGRRNSVHYEKFECLNFRTIDDGKKESYDLYNKAFKKKLVMCIKHHQQLHKLFNEFKIYFKQFFSAELITVGASFSFCIYCLVEENDPESYTTLIGVTWLLLSNFFCRCYIGEKFSEMNKNIGDTIFHDLNWCDQNLENRRLICIFHLMTTFAFRLSGLFNVFECSFFTFTNVVKKSYTYFNLIRSSHSFN